MKIQTSVLKTILFVTWSVLCYTRLNNRRIVPSQQCAVKIFNMATALFRRFVHAKYTLGFLAFTAKNEVKNN